MRFSPKFITRSSTRATHNLPRGALQYPFLTRLSLPGTFLAAGPSTHADEQPHRAGPDGARQRRVVAHVGPRLCTIVHLDFVERRKGEVRRMPKRRSSQNSYSTHSAE